MERVLIEDKLYLIGYHTQEFRGDTLLSHPLKCTVGNAWLGIGYYFWTELEFAKYWGEDSKKNQTGYYDVYKAVLDDERCINAVFDEQGYFFFRRSIEETIDYFKSNDIEISLEQVHRFLTDNIWRVLGVDGIIYDDKPTNPRKSDRIYSEIPQLYYKKRIQIVLFSLKNIRSFEMFLQKQS